MTEHTHIIASDRVTGTNVFNPAGEKLGHLEKIMLDKYSGRVAFALMSFGGFLGIGTRFHPLPWGALKYDTAKEGYVVDLDKKTLEAYVRHLNLYPAGVTIMVSDPKPSEMPGLLEVNIVASMGQASEGRTYLVSKDGSRFMEGRVYDIGQNPFKKELGLTADQSVRIDKIWEATRPELRQEWDSLSALETKLSKMIQADADEAALTRQIDRVETARASANKSRSLMLVQMLKVLTPDQRTRFTALHDRWQQDNVPSPARPSDPPRR